MSNKLNLLGICGLLAIRLLLLSLKNIKITEKEFTITYWKKHEMHSWKEVESLKVFINIGLNIGRIKMKDKKIYYFVNFKPYYINRTGSNNLIGSKNEIESIKSIYSI